MRPTVLYVLPSTPTSDCFFKPRCKSSVKWVTSVIPQGYWSINKIMDVKDQEERPAPDKLASIHFTKRKKSYFHERIKQPKKQLEEKRKESRRAGREEKKERGGWKFMERQGKVRHHYPAVSPVTTRRHCLQRPQPGKVTPSKNQKPYTKTILTGCPVPGIPTRRVPTFTSQELWQAEETVSRLPVTCVLPLESSLAKWPQGPQWWRDWGRHPRAPSGHSVAKQRSCISPRYGGDFRRRLEAGPHPATKLRTLHEVNPGHHPHTR